MDESYISINKNDEEFVEREPVVTDPNSESNSFGTD